jgi:transposase
MLTDEGLNVGGWDMQLLLGYPRELARLVPLHVFIAVTQEDLSWDLNRLVERIMNKVALVTSGAALWTMVHPTGYSLIVLGLLNS